MNGAIVTEPNGPVTSYVWSLGGMLAIIEIVSVDAPHEAITVKIN
jgi:hypothetical protein